MEMANSLCSFECEGYYADPYPGELWPGETREEWYWRMWHIYDEHWDEFLREYVFSEDPPLLIGAKPLRILGDKQ